MSNAVIIRRRQAGFDFDVAMIQMRMRQHTNVRLMFLFGSRACGAGRKDSDIDLAFLLDSWSDTEGFEVTGRLVNACAGVFPCHLMDVVILNAASSVLSMRVLKTGCLLYEREPDDCKRFTVRTARVFQDGEYRRKMNYNWRLARIREGVQHGGSGDILAAARGVARLFKQT